MKKNRMMRLASGLLVAVLLTTSMIAGTFAKYTTQDSAYDSARVAKWGVELQAVGNLYGETYKDLIVEDVKDSNGNENITVQSVDKATDVVAPGTKNEEGFTFSLKGQPEVDGIVTTEMKIQNVFLAKGIYGVMIPVDANVITEANFNEFTSPKYNTTSNTFNKEEAGLYYKSGDVFEFTDKWLDDVEYYTLEDQVKTENYYPVVYKLDGNTENPGKYSTDSLKEAADKIAVQLGLTDNSTQTKTEGAVTTYTLEKKFDSNTNLANWKLDGLTLTWNWAFGDKEKVGDAADTTDKADTILGMLISYRERTDLNPDNLEGTVVKLNDGGAYVAPVEYTDYCLDTQFSIDITVTQVD